MNNKLIVLLIAIIGFSMCVSPIMAAEPSYSILDSLFGTNQLDVQNLIIEKENYQHTDANGKVDKKTNYYIEFDVNSDSDSIGQNTAIITSYDKNNKKIETITYDIDTVTDYKLKFDKSKGIDHVDIVIKDENGGVVFNNTTDHIKKTNDITKDEPVVKKSSSSSSSDATYWASSKSDKFHVPSCEWGQKIASYNKVVFHSRSEAINSGYQPCEVCNP